MQSRRPALRPSRELQIWRAAGYSGDDIGILLCLQWPLPMLLSWGPVRNSEMERAPA